MTVRELHLSKTLEADNRRLKQIVADEVRTIRISVRILYSRQHSLNSKRRSPQEFQGEM